MCQGKRGNIEAKKQDKQKIVTMPIVNQSRTVFSVNAPSSKPKSKKSQG